MRKPRNRYLVLLLLGIISIVLLISFIRFIIFERYQEAFENAKNVSNISFGMDVDEVVQIMGRPDTILDNKHIRSLPDKTNIYYYENKPGKSEPIRILIDSADTVIEVITKEK